LAVHGLGPSIFGGWKLALAGAETTGAETPGVAANSNPAAKPAIHPNARMPIAPTFKLQGSLSAVAAPATAKRA
jgi:hypothetical protein